MTPYELWLLQETDPDKLAGLLYMEIVETNNPQAWKIMEEAIGNEKITKDSFFIAAKYLIDKNKTMNK